MKVSLSFPESCNEEVKGALMEFVLKKLSAMFFSFSNR